MGTVCVDKNGNDIPTSGNLPLGNNVKEKIYLKEFGMLEPKIS
jgi:hypothetical protein